MATLTIRRLDREDHEWLCRVAREEGVSMEEYVRRMVRSTRLETSRTLGDVLDAMNASIDEHERALLTEPHSFERSPLRARDLLRPDDDEDVMTRAAS